MIADWNALARKHGISSWTLPNCHQSLRQELDGNVEARKLLLDAKREKELALKEYVDACKQLSYERKEVGNHYLHLGWKVVHFKFRWLRVKVVSKIPIAGPMVLEFSV